MQRAREVDGDQFVPLRWLGLGEGLEYVPASVVDEYIHRPQFFLGGRHGSIHARAISDVAAQRECRTSDCADTGRDFFGGVRMEVKHGDSRAFFAKAQAGGSADAAAAARHDDCLVFESLHWNVLRLRDGSAVCR